jgi:hypothetical protein
MKYESFPVVMETKSMHELSLRIRAGGDHKDFVIDTELKNLANEIDARLQKVAAGITVLKPEEDWLS